MFRNESILNLLIVLIPVAGLFIVGYADPEKSPPILLLLALFFLSLVLIISIAFKESTRQGLLSLIPLTFYITG